MKKKFLTIKRITPPVSKKSRFSIQEVIEAAKKVREAVYKEEKKYGRLGFT